MIKKIIQIITSIIITALLSICFLVLVSKGNQSYAYEITDYINMRDIRNSETQSVWALTGGKKRFAESPYWYGVELGDGLLVESPRGKDRFSPVGDEQELPQEVAYVTFLEQQNAGANYSRGDSSGNDTYNPTSNVVWSVMGIDIKGTYISSSHANYRAYIKLYHEAKAQAVIKDSGNVKVTKPQNLIVENPSSSEAGKYGPFTVIYPSYTTSNYVSIQGDLNKNFVGTKLVVTLNKGTTNQKVLFKIENGVATNYMHNRTSSSAIPKSGEEFYLSDEDGIIYGKENKITVDYEGNRYTGKYRLYTRFNWGWYPLMEKTYSCRRCGASKTFSAWGWWPATVEQPITSTWRNLNWYTDPYTTFSPSFDSSNSVWREKLKDDSYFAYWAGINGDAGTPYDEGFGYEYGSSNLKYNHQYFSVGTYWYKTESTWYRYKKETTGTIYSYSQPLETIPEGWSYYDTKVNRYNYTEDMTVNCGQDVEAFSWTNEWWTNTTTGAWSSSTGYYGGHTAYKGTQGYRLDGYGGLASCQDYIKVSNLQKKTIPDSAETSFWAGKPDIKINLAKTSTSGEKIAGAKFQVTDVINGKIDGSDIIETDGVNDKIFSIKPNKGKTEVIVTIKEIYVPDNDYVLYREPIKITYKWDNTTKQWYVNDTLIAVQDPKYQENITVNRTSQARAASNCLDRFILAAVNRPTIKIKLNKIGTTSADKNLTQDYLGEEIYFKIVNLQGADYHINEMGTVQSDIVKAGDMAIIDPYANVVEGAQIYFELQEIYDGEEFIKFKENIKITFQYSNGQWNIKNLIDPTGETVNLVSNEPNKIGIEAINRRKIIINLHKTDNAKPVQNSLSGINFGVSVTGGYLEGVSGTNIITDNNGNIKLKIIPHGTNDVEITLKEQESIYLVNMPEIKIRFTYQNGEWVIKQSGTITNSQVGITRFGISKFNMNIENIAKINDLVLVKENLNYIINGNYERIPGVKFEVTLNNAKFMNYSGKNSITVTTNENGEIDIGGLEILNPSNDIVITLKETGVQIGNLNYYGLLNNGEVRISIRYRNSSYQVIDIQLNNEKNINKQQLAKVVYDANTTNSAKISIRNNVTMDLNGMVWEDGQTGIKPVKTPNGKKDGSESSISGVVVNLKKSDGAILKTVKTDSTGYKFIDLPASVRGALGYYIEFEYDGINYIATAAGGDSDATEKNRAAFNGKFTTITKDMANGIGGAKTPLEYSYSSSGATLETTVGGVVKEKFKITADTLSTIYSKTTKNVDLGLVRKSVDLAAVTDIERALITINGESKEYNYNDIASLKKDQYGNAILSNLEKETQYNLFLYNSDYNYRIGDYQLPAARRDSLTVSERGASGDLLARREQDGELNVQVTYQVLLSNQSATNATINQIAYYYDSRYILKGVSIDAGTVSVAGVTQNAATIGSVTYNKAILNVNADLTNTDNQRVIDLTFDVGKDGAGNLYTGIMENLVEIISYSTSSGCIDRDSAPDNVEKNSNEDDTDDAAGFNVKLNGLQRQVSGFVFEDEKTNNPSKYNIGDGVYDASNRNEKKIDDVIVQLIEIKDVTVGGTTLRLEYIWQETISGSDTVRYVTIDGLSQGTYTVSNAAGQYTFNKNIIPGDYIVRFIYGDGTYYDSASAANLLKYNGQDYKSTKDVGYDKTIHQETIYSPNSSMARDNEARRLEEMAYATGVTVANAADLKIDTKDKLNATWMYAETSPLLMKISDATSEGDTNSIRKNINFGLVERPKLSLSLEKHITGLYISGSNGVNATTTLGEYQQALTNGLVVDVSDNEVFATATNKEKNNRGTWKIETEPDKIDGAQLKITYGYAVKNIGDIDYIGDELRRLLNEEGKTYTEIATQVKNQSSKPSYIPGAYLGTAYYNGTKTTDVATTIGFQVEDYMSTTNGLQLDATTDFKEASPATASKNIWDYVSSGVGSRSHTNTATETVRVLQSNIYTLSADTETQLVLTLYDDHLDATSSASDLTYRSYAAQLIYPSSGLLTSQSGTICNTQNTLGNLKTVQSYVVESAVPISDIVPETDEFIAETVIITKDTGGDRVTPIFLIITITSGLAIVAVGIVLIKKFVIK